VYVRAQTTKLVQTITIACSSSAMLEHAQLNAIVSTDSTRRTCRVVSRRDEPRGIWAYIVTRVKVRHVVDLYIVFTIFHDIFNVMYCKLYAGYYRCLL